jgi:hypothetical protein
MTKRNEGPTKGAKTSPTNKDLIRSQAIDREWEPNMFSGKNMVVPLHVTQDFKLCDVSKEFGIETKICTFAHNHLGIKEREANW